MKHEALCLNINFVEQAISAHKLFILDYHDAFFPYFMKINSLPIAKGYGTRTILFLKDDRSLKPLAIELTQPAIVSKVVMPATKEMPLLKQYIYEHYKKMLNNGGYFAEVLETSLIY